MQNSEYGKISSSLDKNINLLKSLTHQSNDLVIREIYINKIRCAAIAAEGMVNSFYYSSIITDNLCANLPETQTAEELYDYIYNSKIISPEENEFFTIDELFVLIYSGFGVILVDGIASGISFGAQGFSFRSVTSPSTDENIKGSKEGFTEAIKINQTLIRRRLKTPELVFEPLLLGSKSKTNCALVYMNDIVSKKMLKEIRNRLSKADIDMILESGSVKMLLTEKPLSLFSEISSTERPDTLAKNLYEGKVGILIDGTPFVLIVPFLFAEHFHSLDDFEYKAVYSNFIRFLKYTAFVVSMILPGLYVAVATHHPYMLSPVMQEKISQAGTATPYSYLVEALLIHFAYEIMKEAGLRLPKEIGHAVSIVGGLIIGDAAVSAGIISAPMVIVAALAAISAFIIPTLMDSLVIMRFANIILGGFMGMYGIALGIAFVSINICAKTVFGIPYSSSMSPSDRRSRTSFLFKSFGQQYASSKVPKIYEMPGTGDSNQKNMRSCSDKSQISAIVLLILSLSAALFSIYIFTKCICTMVLPDMNAALVVIPIIALAVIFRNCNTDGCKRLSELFLFFFSAGALIVAFKFLLSGQLMTDIVEVFAANDIYLLLTVEIMALLLFIPFCQKHEFSQLRAVIFLDILAVTITLLLSTEMLISLLPFSAFFLTGLEFVKLLYVINVIKNVFRLSFCRIKA